jgi:type III secretion inner rod protein HrpB2
MDTILAPALLHQPPMTLQAAGPSVPEIAPDAAERFAALMQQGQLVPATNPSDSGGNVATELVRNEDAALQSVANDIDYLMQHVDSMTMSQFTAASMQVQIEAGSLQVDMQTKLSVVTSSKEALDSLMKNQ